MGYMDTIVKSQTKRAYLFHLKGQITKYSLGVRALLKLNFFRS